MTEITLRERIKQKLHRYNSIRHEAADIVSQIEQIREVMESPRMVELDGMPHGSGGGTDPLAGLIDELQALEAKYKDKLHRLHEAMAEVEDMAETESLDSTERRLLRYRYIKDLTWEEVCVKLGYSWSQTHRIHSGVLDKLEAAELERVDR